jgi:catechol 2,3-dioxygenase-like lactoylglutathione lyase family enzyme
LPKLYRIILPVAEIEAAVAFYRALLGQDGHRVSPGRHYFDCEGTILACYDAVADGDAEDGNAFTPLPEPLYLAVDDLEATFRTAQEAGADFSPEAIPGVGPLGEIARRPWGERSVYAADPFGNPLCFVERGTEFTG